MKKWNVQLTPASTTIQVWKSWYYWLQMCVEVKEGNKFEYSKLYTS